MSVWDGRMHVDLEPPYLVIKPGVTEDEFYRLADEDSDWEYLDGRIVMHSPASYRHEDLFRFLMTLVSVCLGERGGAIVVGSRYPMRLDADWSPEPELVIVRESRRHLLTTKFLDGPADLAVEIVSESDPRLDYREKLPRYREAGIEEIWIINPFTREVRVDIKQPDGYAVQTLTEGRLESAVVQGFWIDVSWLWQDPLPAPLPCVQSILG